MINLSSLNKKHTIIIKLDKDKRRELALRQHLDFNADVVGINRKESILKLFELAAQHGLIEPCCGEISNNTSPPKKIPEKQVENDVSDASKVTGEGTASEVRDSNKVNLNTLVESVDTDDYDNI